MIRLKLSIVFRKWTKEESRIVSSTCEHWLIRGMVGNISLAQIAASLIEKLRFKNLDCYELYLMIEGWYRQYAY